MSVTPKIECVATRANYGRFVVEPLEAGFGVTLGNALRRTLLSSLTGAAVTWIRIDGVLHEFSTVPHMKEDVTSFLLNVKQLRLRPLTDRPGKMYLEADGEGKVSAADITPSVDYEIINPELHLATLDAQEAVLRVEFNVETGKGYVPASQSDGLPIGVIPVDAIFSPVRKVNYTVEHTRVGQVTNYDRLVLEVWTDGTIQPAEAINQSAEVLISYFSIFAQTGRGISSITEKHRLRMGTISRERYDTPIEALGLSARAYNCLRREGITKIGEILEMSEEDLLAVKNFGQKSLDELRQRLEQLGYIAPAPKAPVPFPKREPTEEQKEGMEEDVYSVIEEELGKKVYEAEDEEDDGDDE
ncbi:MAG: DNA-directed RNA polymerase subunit alpha [Chloroflexi bacterium]|nr:DNA-directed RNA polymerase subunit alpha [Chloroflexota bacterium]